MDLIIFCIQFAFGLLVYGLIADIFALSRLRALPWKRALLILTVPHAFRYLGLFALTQAAYNPEISQQWANSTAYGDLGAQIFAAGTLLALHRDWPIGIPLAWLCHLIGLYAFVDSTLKIVSTHVPLHSLYAGWFLPVFYVPVLVWSHFFSFRLLFLRRL